MKTFVTPASLLFSLRKPEATTAWNRFVELYTPLLFHWARQLGLQNSDCADLIQDVFLTLWRKLPEFEYDADRSFHAWLKTVFLNHYRSRLRRNGPATVDVGAHDCMDASTSPLLDADDAQYLIRQAFRLIEHEFSELHQRVFRAYVLEQRSPEQVAADVGIQPGTVYGVKSKILSRLRQVLQGMLD
jgi:RNA polymerase sigma-70 factor (ECF subfamily)